MRLERPGLDALREAARAGTIEAVWCWAPDRLARSYHYQVTVLDELVRHRVAVRFAHTPTLDGPRARRLAQLLAALTRLVTIESEPSPVPGGPGTNPAHPERRAP